MSERLHEKCLICDGKYLTPLRGYQKFYLVQCRLCGFVFSQKIPDDHELISIYKNYGRDDYLSPVTVKRFHQILDALEKFRLTNNLLDVGCGIGYFLEAARSRGWNVYGTEFTENAVEICRRKEIIMHQGELNPGNYKAEYFDVIISIEVIEHINHPVEEVRKFSSVLRSGGAVYLTTPNFNSLSRKMLKEKWNVLAYPEHLCYYTSRTLKRLFQKQNFTDQKIETTGISITRMKAGITQSDQKAIAAGSEDEKIRKAIEGNPVLQLFKSAINNSLNLIKGGDNLKATFIKK